MKFLNKRISLLENILKIHNIIIKNNLIVITNYINSTKYIHFIVEKKVKFILNFKYHRIPKHFRINRIKQYKKYFFLIFNKNMCLIFDTKTLKIISLKGLKNKCYFYSINDNFLTVLYNKTYYIYNKNNLRKLNFNQIKENDCINSLNSRFYILTIFVNNYFFLFNTLSLKKLKFSNWNYKVKNYEKYETGSNILLEGLFEFMMYDKKTLSKINLKGLKKLSNLDWSYTAFNFDFIRFSNKTNFYYNDYIFNKTIYKMININKLKENDLISDTYIKKQKLIIILNNDFSYIFDLKTFKRIKFPKIKKIKYVKYFKKFLILENDSENLFYDKYDLIKINFKFLKENDKITEFDNFNKFYFYIKINDYNYYILSIKNFNNIIDFNWNRDDKIIFLERYFKTLLIFKTSNGYHYYYKFNNWNKKLFKTKIFTNLIKIKKDFIILESNKYKNQIAVINKKFKVKIYKLNVVVNNRSSRHYRSYYYIKKVTGKYILYNYRYLCIENKLINTIYY